MKILIDQNISHRIKSKISSIFPLAFHVKDLNLIDENDYKIFAYARKEHFDAIVTIDDDFQRIIFERGTPPKIIWLRIKNCSTDFLAQKIIGNETVINNFLQKDEHDLLQIF